MLDNLAVIGMPAPPNGGIYQTDYVIGADWAYRQTGAPRFAKIAWDVARSLADLIPQFDYDPTTLPFVHKVIGGNRIWRNFLLPMLIGLSQDRARNTTFRTRHHPHSRMSTFNNRSRKPYTIRDAYT